MKKEKCVCCDGLGFIYRNNINSNYSTIQKKKAISLYKKGLSYRNICKETGIRHPQSVKNIIFNANKIINEN